MKSVELLAVCCVCTDVFLLFSYSSILHARRHNSQQVCRHRITGQQLSEHPAADTGTGPRARPRTRGFPSFTAPSRSIGVYLCFSRCLFSSRASCAFFRAASCPIALVQRLLLSRASSILSSSVMLHLFHLVLHLTCAVYVKPHPPAFRSPLPRNIWKQSQTAWSPLPPLSPCLPYIYETPFSILPVLQPYFDSLFIFNSVSLPLALALPLLHTYGAITLPPFVITGMFTLFPLAYSHYSALRKWKSVWALRSDSLRVLINPLGVRSDVEVSFLTKTMDLFFCLWNTIALKLTWRRTTTRISLTNNNELCMPSIVDQGELQLRDEMANGTAEGRGKKKDCGQRDLIESRSGRLVTPNNQTWCHSHLISNLWRGCSRLGRGEKKIKRGHCLLPGI